MQAFFYIAPFLFLYNIKKRCYIILYKKKADIKKGAKHKDIIKQN